MVSLYRLLYEDSETISNIHLPTRIYVQNHVLKKQLKIINKGNCGKGYIFLMKIVI